MRAHDEQVVADEIRQLSAHASEEVREILERVVQALQLYDVKVVTRALGLAPIAQAKGDSSGEIDLAMDRWSRGLTANIFISLQPDNRRFPVEVIGTGKINPFASAIGKAS